MTQIFDALRATAGFRKFAVLGIIALVLLIANIWTSADTSLIAQQNSARASRLNTLLQLGAEYKQQASHGQSRPKAADPASVFARISERMELGSRVNRITPDGLNQSIEVNRLYAEELAELCRQLTDNGVRIIAAELRALPAGSERLFTLSAVIGGAQ